MNNVSAQSLMVDIQIRNRGINDERVLEAMQNVPRAHFVPEENKRLAYDDRPLSIGNGQTISQPYIVAYMSEAAQIKRTDRILEIGSGCGYQTAILCHLASEVCSIEIIEDLYQMALKNLKSLNLKNFHLKRADGKMGWPDKAPFDVILIAAASPAIPTDLMDQLKIGGRLMMPVGETNAAQELIRLIKTSSDYKKESLLACRFVPLT